MRSLAACFFKHKYFYFHYSRSCSNCSSREIWVPHLYLQSYWSITEYINYRRSFNRMVKDGLLIVDCNNWMSDREEKQRYLRENILDKDYDAEEFMEFCESYKGSMDIDSWTLQELQNVNIWTCRLCKSSLQATVRPYNCLPLITVLSIKIHQYLTALTGIKPSKRIVAWVNQLSQLSTLTQLTLTSLKWWVWNRALRSKNLSVPHL